LNRSETFQECLNDIGHAATALWHFVGTFDHWSEFFAAAFGSLVAFELERQRRRFERRSAERAKTNRLISTIGRMIWVLEDVNEALFEILDNRLGRQALWNEIGPVPGIPVPGAQIAFGDFDFLLETNDSNDQAPAVLGRIEFAERRFNGVLSLASLRTTSVYEYQAKSADASNRIGMGGLAYQATANAAGKRVEELTHSLREDIPETLRILGESMGQLRELIAKRYPGKRQITLTALMRPKEAAQPAHSEPPAQP
jgi:hypothetical protein